MSLLSPIEKLLVHASASVKCKFTFWSICMTYRYSNIFQYQGKKYMDSEKECFFTRNEFNFEKIMKFLN